ncbi:MAG TPA: protein kinase [Myxococcota bacterium]|jgi:WD40 repeat protein/serine/threonine protein kinase|nr:protein kinase [Myxococcota bacterium]
MSMTSETSCRAVQSGLFAGTPGDAAAAHLASCRRCARFREALVALEDDLGNASTADNAASDAALAAGETLEAAVFARAAGRLASAAADLPTVDPALYRLDQELGIGGMGRIVAARDLRLGRPVAIKELRKARPDLMRRFQREALLTARLQHPAIVCVYEAGRWPSGEPFYAMKLVTGKPLDRVVAETPRFDERLALLPAVITVADALAYAHEQRIIHRDLKPANVLVGAFGETVVIDWGLAKDLSAVAVPDEVEAAPAAAAGAAAVPDEPAAQPSETKAGAVLGTPAYMPPEQAQGHAVDERADVYAIGALLYELLAGCPPYAGAKVREVILQVCAGPPRPLAKAQPAVPPDLLTIVSKAMARDPASRYPSARELAEELRRFQAGQLVAAHAYSSWELARRWLLRRRGVVAVIGAAVALSAAVAAASFARVVAERNRATRAAADEAAARTRADDARAAADEARAEAERAGSDAADRLEALLVANARAELPRDPTAAAVLLDGLPARSLHWVKAVDLAADAVAAGVARTYVGAHPAFAPDGRTLYVAASHGVVAEDVDGSRRVLTGGGSPGPLAVSPDGDWVAEGSPPGVRLFHDGAVSFADVGPRGGGDAAVVFHPTAPLLASLDGDGRARSWRLGSGSGRGSGSGGGGRAGVGGGDGPVLATDAVAVSFSRDGAWIAVVERRSVSLVAADGGKSRVLPGPGVSYGRAPASFSPDGGLVAVAAGDTVRLWNLATDKVSVLPSAEGDVRAIAFGPRGLLAAATERGPIVVWDVATGTRTALAGHALASNALAFSPDGLLASGGEDGTVRLWELPAGATHVLRGHGAAVTEVVFSAAGGGLASASADGTVRWWRDAALSPDRLGTLDSAVSALVFSPDGAGRLLVAAGSEGAPDLRLWDTGANVARVIPADRPSVPVFSPDAAHLAVAGTDTALHDLYLWDVAVPLWVTPAGHARAIRDAGPPLAFSPYADVLVARRREGPVAWRRLGEPAASVVEPLTRDGIAPAGVRSVAFAPIGWPVAVGGTDGVTLFRAELGPPIALSWPGVQVAGLRFSPDGTRLAAFAAGNAAIRIWDVATGDERTLIGHEEPVAALAFAAAGDRLYSYGADCTVRAWDLATGKDRLLGTTGLSLRSASFSDDGGWLATADGGRDVIVWDLEADLRRVVRFEAPVSRVALSPGGARLAVASDRTVYLRDLRPAFSTRPESPDDAAAWLAAATDVGTAGASSSELPDPTMFLSPEPGPEASAPVASTEAAAKAGEYSFGPGTLMMAKKLELDGPLAADSVSMRKPSNDRVYVFHFAADERAAIEGLVPGLAYDVIFRVHTSCPTGGDVCGDFVSADEH